MSWFKKKKRAIEMTKITGSMARLAFAANGLGDAAKCSQENLRAFHKVALKHRRGQR